MKKNSLVFLLLTLFSFYSFSQSKDLVVFNEDFATGEHLFKINKPIDAIPFLEKALETEGVDPAVYIYLGVAYYQTGKFSDSLSVCVRGLARENTDHKILAFNAGNSAYAIGNYARADACYAIAVKTDPEFSPAVLNRANAQLKQDHLQDAKDNYELFLTLDPDNEQNPQIIELIALLEAEILRRANEKPELIIPEDFVNNEEDIVPALEFEKIEYENPALPQEEKIDYSEILPASESVAPEMRYYEPKDLNLEHLNNGDAQAPLQKYYTPEDKSVEAVEGDAVPSEIKYYEGEKSFGEQLPAAVIKPPALPVPDEVKSDSELYINQESEELIEQDVKEDESLTEPELPALKEFD